MRVLSCAFVLGIAFVSAASFAKPSSLDLALEELGSRLEDPTCTIETMAESAVLLQKVVDAALRKSNVDLRALLETIKNTPVRSDGSPVTFDKQVLAMNTLSVEGKVGARVKNLLTKHFLYNSHEIRATGAGIGAAAVVGGSGNGMVGVAENQFGKLFMLTAEVGVAAFPALGAKLLIGRIVGSTDFDGEGIHKEDWGHSGDRLRGGSFVFGGMRLRSPYSVAGNYTLYFLSVGTIGDYPFYVNLRMSKGHALDRKRNYAGFKKRLGIA